MICSTNFKNNLKKTKEIKKKSLNDVFFCHFNDYLWFFSYFVRFYQNLYKELKLRVFECRWGFDSFLKSLQEPLVKPKNCR